jgi:5-methylthioadenosine/S-adenosylhomocysteine deaminase
MPRADRILKNAYIVTMDEQYRIIPDGALAVESSSIAGVGPSEDIVRQFETSEVVDCSGKVMIPGLINGHTHAAMTMLRGLADDLRLDVWLLGYMMPVEREFVSPTFCSLGTKLACAEMIRSGITTFADMYYFEDTVAEATSEAGLRAVCGQTVLKFPAPDGESYEDTIARSLDFILRWKDHDLITPAVAPHAPYTCTSEILRACTQLAVDHDVPLHIHIAETTTEVEEWINNNDMPVVPWLDDIGMLEAKVIAAHCVHLEESEFLTLQRKGAGVIHNPSSNLKLASGFAPIADMLARDVNVGIGTDGPASNNDLDMFEEIRLASFIAKAITEDPTALPAQQAFDLATRVGAKAIHLGHKIGSLEVGKQADLALIDLEKTHNQPHFQRELDGIYSRLVYAAKSTDVIDVMVAGKWLMQDRNLLTIKEDGLIQESNTYAVAIDDFLREREGSVLSKLIAIGGAEQEESYEVQIKLRLDDPQPIVDKLEGGIFEIIRTAHYLEYDTYFSFPEPESSRLRYREDEFVNQAGEVYQVRARLTLTGPAAEREYPNSVLLSRSRFIAPAIYTPRFYREYFKPIEEIDIQKDRKRWLIKYEGVDFFLNIDEVLKPPVAGFFFEIKSRTWSRVDAELKADLITGLLKILDVPSAEPVTIEYPDLVSK